jgi:hypothetical protein
MRKILTATVLGFAAASLTAPSIAQVSGGLVNVPVTIEDVSILNDSLNKNQIAALNNIGVPIVVQVPIALAANVCGTTVAVLAAAGSAAACDAKSGNKTLGQAAVRQALKQKDAK